MTRWISRLSLNQRLGGVALALGTLAVFADVAPGRTLRLHAKELLTSVERREDHVTAGELAGWIVAGRADYRLVDVRDEKAFAEYHVPGAENVPLAAVLDGTLSRADKLVLYGDGGVHAAQAWMVLRGSGYRHVYTLLDGLDAWKDEVLFPVAPERATPEQQARFERDAERARFFGGQPRAAAAPGSAPVALPTPPSAAAARAPTLPPGTAGGPRKKRQGC